MINPKTNETMKTELSNLVCIDRKGRLILNFYDLQLNFVTVIIGLWDEKLFKTIDLIRQK